MDVSCHLSHQPALPVDPKEERRQIRRLRRGRHKSVSVDAQMDSQSVGCLLADAEVPVLDLREALAGNP